ncbi:MAG: serine/threonine protein kinase [Verrucomicrobiales bacterium]|nr:serine/threonine protein kinase [Verrucomicrobiales bacterium]|tara:strand:- start:4995 stop:5954 length:960 start_codon:yes stop_codon:yes gene_type:complete
MVSCGKCEAKCFISSGLGAFETAECTKCGHPVMIPVQMRQFELREVIASGGMGTVFKSWDINLRREVAVKLMKPDIAEDPAQVEEFVKESRACAGLNHTNIIHIYSFDEIDGNKYLVMELAENGTLDDRIENEGIVPELDVLDVGIKIASALDAALRHNLLHLDIKPGNILFNNDSPPEPKLVDFGLAKSADEERGYEEEGGIFGTPYYIAPERLSENREDFRSDMYSLGGTLYHALVGHVPFDAPEIHDVAQAHIQEPLIPPNHEIADIQEITNEAICRAMAKNPDERYQSYDEFIMALTAARSHLLIQKYGGGGAFA